MMYLAADHGGYALKNELVRFLAAKGHVFTDLSSPLRNPKDDYPDIARKAVRSMKTGSDSSVLICGSGNGMAIVANRSRRIRAALCLTPFMARKARQDEDANVLVLAGRITSCSAARRILTTWLATNASRHPRHVRRRKKLTHIS